VRTSFGPLDKGEGVAEVGRERVFGGEDVLAGADLHGAIPAGGADELLDGRPARASMNRVTARAAKT
jgi:hypothetical protein